MERTEVAKPGLVCSRCQTNNLVTARACAECGAAFANVQGRVACPACGETDMVLTDAGFECREGCGGKRVPESVIEDLFLNDGLMMEDVIRVLGKLRGYVGVGWYTYGDWLRDLARGNAR